MDWETLIEMLRNPPAEGLPETIYDDLSAVHNGVLEGSQQRDAEHAAALEAAENDGNTRLEAAGLEHEASAEAFKAEIADLKSQVYDLTMQIGIEPDGSEAPSADEIDAAEDVPYESLFDDSDDDNAPGADGATVDLFDDEDDDDDSEDD